MTYTGTHARKLSRREKRTTDRAQRKANKAHAASVTALIIDTLKHMEQDA